MIATTFESLFAVLGFKLEEISSHLTA